VEKDDMTEQCPKDCKPNSGGLPIAVQVVAHEDLSQQGVRPVGRVRELAIAKEAKELGLGT
jgi:hypothetical protein